MNFTEEDNLTEEELELLEKSCRVLEVPKSSFQEELDRTKSVALKMSEKLLELIYEGEGRQCSVAEPKLGMNVPKLVDWLKDLGRTEIPHRSWSLAEVRIIDEFIVLSNNPQAKDCLRLTHNQNLLFNIERKLENEYRKSKEK